MITLIERLEQAESGYRAANDFYAADLFREARLALRAPETRSASFEGMPGSTMLGPLAPYYAGSPQRGVTPPLAAEYGAFTVAFEGGAIQAVAPQDLRTVAGGGVRKLEIGRKGKTREGKIIGPIKPWRFTKWPFWSSGHSFTEFGFMSSLANPGDKFAPIMPGDIIELLPEGA